MVSPPVSPAPNLSDRLAGFSAQGFEALATQLSSNGGSLVTLNAADDDQDELVDQVMYVWIG